ncbi:YhdP family protein [Hyphococcus luteus]|uniref:YhdP central domain-containing protein n=1 Tax=Hyphococcus luteus TaxID=2058213 RepID=A0A2S7K908_9PROT|nr:AsmA-like C-terminal domain-containing protein [Marinicaulis flavus]PQA88994.1 hypothetical protein CW354_03330 [Marinicaulis flavus]
MKKRALRSAVLAFEVLALVIAIAAAAVIFLSWRLAQGPVALDLLKPSVEFAIERRLPPGYDAVIESMELHSAEARGEYRLQLQGLTLVSEESREAASAPEILMTFDLGDFLAGEIGPKTVTAQGASFRIIRREDLNVDIPIVKRPSSKSRGDQLSAMLDGRLLKSAFESAELSDARITFLDVASGRAWAAPHTQVHLRRTENGLAALLEGKIDMGGVGDGAKAGVKAEADYDIEMDVINVVVDGDNFPVGDLLSTFYGDRAAIVDAPVSGRAVIAFTSEGDVLTSKFDARVGEGFLRLGGARRAVSHIEWETGFDPLTNRFSIDRFEFDLEGAKGTATGEVSISFGDDIRQPESISFELASEEIVVTAPDELPAPLAFSALGLDGQYFVSDRRLALSSLEAEFGGLAARGMLTFLRPRGFDGGPDPSPGVIADIDIDGSLDPEGVLAIWPRSLATGARDWVEARLETAVIDNIDFSMNLVPGAIPEDGGFPDEALTLTFDARNGKAHYIQGMTPMRNGSGRGVLHGNSFLLTVDSARIGDVAIRRGEVSFPVFWPKWRPTYYRFTADGAAEDMLAVLDEAPLSLLSKVNLSASQFSGEARAEIEIMRPNKRDVPPEDYGYEGEATFKNMTIAELIGGIQLSNASGTVDLKTRSMTVSSKAEIAEDAPIEMTWRQNFYKEDGPSKVSLSGVFNSSTGDLFGVSTRRFLRGPVAFEAEALGDFGAFETLDVKTDFKDAALMMDALGWRKPTGAPAAGELAMAFNRDGVAVKRLSVEGDNVNIFGALSFDANGALQKADLPRFYLADAADFAVTAQRDAAGTLDLTAVGDFLNVGPLVQDTLEGSAAPESDSGLVWGQGVNVRARIDQIALREGVLYRDGALDLFRDAERLQALDFSAFSADGKPLTMTMALTGAEDGPERAIEARTSAIGELMKGIFGLDSIAGGEGSMRIALHQTGKPGFEGELEARNLQVVNAPLLARIFSAGSLDGLANLLNGEGIDFSYAYGKFDYADGVVSVDDMRATGSSVGITAEGVVGVGAGGQADLNGAVAPLYAINSVLGNAPIIGDILVGKKGEGILAFSYRVSGETGNPSVFVNPLSALTPGIFRQLMQPQRETAPEEEAAPAETPGEDSAPQPQ